jgi:predicted phage terminase large subunit-like protein
MPLHDRPGRSGKIIDGLTTIREKAGTVIFNLQYQNDVELMKRGDIFHYDWFKWYSLETREDGQTYILRDDGIEIPVSRLEIYGGIDPAVGEGDRNDYFAVGIIGMDRATQDYYLLDIYKARLSYDQRARIVDGKFQQWHPRIFGIEDVGFQKEFVQRIRKTFPYIRVKEIKTDKDKVSRAYGRSGLVENGKIFVKKGMHDFVEELCIMPDGAHDDQFDAFDFAMQSSGAVQSGMKTTTMAGSKKYKVQTLFKEKTMAQKLYR